MSQKEEKKGHVPLRTCVICRCCAPQSELTRFVLEAEALTPDTQPCRLGRGWYVCGKVECRERLRRYRPKIRSK